MYTVKELGELSGVSSRTLRYYDSIDLLKPAKISESGYRSYDIENLDRLQHILFYKECGLSLNEIKEILDNPSFDEIKALESHRKQLVIEQEKITQMISTIEKTLMEKKGMITMSDKEKFEGFKKAMIDENTSKYGKEVASAYGSEKVNHANKQIMNMTEEDVDKWKSLEQSIITTLKSFLTKETVTKEEQNALGQMHREWISFTWDIYSREMHKGLVDMYLADERFKAYYDDRAGEGATEALVAAVNVYLKELD